MAEPNLAEPLLVIGSNNLLSSPQSPHDIDPDIVVDYLSRLLNATLGASQDELTAAGSLLSTHSISNTVKLCTRFLREAQVALYAQKIAISFAKEETSQDSQGFICFSIIVFAC